MSSASIRSCPCYGQTLEDLVCQLAREKYQVQGDVDTHEDRGHVNIMLTEYVSSFHDPETDEGAGGL